TDTGLWRSGHEAAMVVVVVSVLFAQLVLSVFHRRESHATLTRSARVRACASSCDEGRFTGLVIDGYTLENVVGRGAMGEVYAAAGEGRRIAVKVLRDGADPELRLRFAREAEIAKMVSGAP